MTAPRVVDHDLDIRNLGYNPKSLGHEGRGRGWG